jgi:3-oxoacyl-[acyl-carrier-protein] synthase I
VPEGGGPRLSPALAQPLAITSIGARTAVGANAAQTCTSIRAGLSGFREHPFYESLSPDPEWEEGEPLVSAMVPTVDPDLGGVDRLLELAGPAVLDLVSRSGLRRADLGQTALLASLPAPDDAVAGWDLGERFIERLASAILLPDPRHVEIERSGRVGAFELVSRAEELLRSGAAQHVLLLASDTFLSEDRAELWDAAGRLRSARNPDGFIPGEAGCAVLLELADRARARSATILAQIVSKGSGEESQPFRSDRASTGIGLCRALLDCLGDGEKAGWIACDLNGESYSAFEWGLVRVRMHERLEGLARLDHPADCLGDVGAATGATLMCHAADALAQRLPPQREATLWAAGDDGRRRAIRLRAPAP